MDNILYDVKFNSSIKIVELVVKVEIGEIDLKSMYL